MELEFFTKHYGFTFFSVSKKEIKVSFVDGDGSVLYEYTRNNKVHALPTLPPPTSPTRPIGKNFSSIFLERFTHSFQNFICHQYQYHPYQYHQYEEQCDETWWPDLDHDLVCDDCKVGFSSFWFSLIRKSRKSFQEKAINSQPDKICSGVCA